MDGFIYILRDPDTEEVRYVGQTIQDPKIRFAHHKKMKNKSDWYVYRWWRTLHVDPVLQIIDRVSVGDLNAVESEWIKFYRQLGCRLTNLTSGGNQNMLVSQETRQRMSDAHKGKTLSKSHRESIARAKIGNTYCLGRAHTEEAKRKISDHSSSNGRKRSPLTQDDVETIRRRYATGEFTLKQLGDEYGVAFQTISKIVRMQRWKI